MSVVRKRVVVADDYEPVLREVEAILTPDFEIVGTAQRGDVLISTVTALVPDVVVADITMPGGDGLTASCRILECHPGLCVVLLTMSTDREVVERALSLGIRGFVHKIAAGDDLVPALCTVLAGGVFVSASCAN